MPPVQKEETTMQINMKLVHIALGCLLLSGGVLLLVSVCAKAPKKAQIAFQSNWDGNYEIYVMDADGNNPRRLTNNPADDWCPSWFDPAFAHPVSPAGKLGTTWGKIKHGLFSR
jgi:hypothetical protein